MKENMKISFGKWQQTKILYQIKKMDPIVSSPEFGLPEYRDPKMDIPSFEMVNIGPSGSLRNILCDEIIFNPSDETVTVTKLQLRKSSYSPKVSDVTNGHPISKEFGTTSKHHEEFEDLSWYKDDPIEDMVCLGATFIITIILLSVLTYCYLFKDYE